MAYNPTNPNGQAAMAASSPVVIASDQGLVPITLNSVGFQYSVNGVNSSVTQLTAGATFTGAIEAIPNQPAYSILVFSDQNATITINEYIDATSTFKVYTKSYSYLANTQFAVSNIANGNYFQIVVQNTGASTTTLLNINTAYGVIGTASQLNNQPMGIYEVNGVTVDANSGNKSAGSQRVVIATDDINLAAINSKTPALGQAAAASSSPVTLSNENVFDLYVTGQSAQTAVINNILTATAGAAATDVQQYRSFAIQVISTGTAGAYIFEGSNDNVNFQSIPVFNQALVVQVPLVTAITATVSNIIYCGACNFRFIRLRISTLITGGSVQAFSTFTQTPFAATSIIVAQGTAANLNTTVSGTVTANLGTGGVAATSLGKAEDAVAVSGDTIVAIGLLRNDALTSNVSATGDYIVPVTDIFGAQIVKDQQRHKRTYRCAFVVAPAATAQDVFQLIGSATTTVEITKIVVSGTQTTGGMVDLYIKKRSTANTGGTSTASTNVPMISTDAAATAVGAIYTANPTLGTDVGNIQIQSLPLSAATATTNNVAEIKFGETGKPVILSGVAQALAINLNGATVTGGSLKITVEFTEY
jgi:hypothetical protein